MKAVYLTPRSTFRNNLRSDTLWGLLLTAIRSVYGNNEVEEIIRLSEENNPPFILSSAMPYMVNNGNKTHFFPKPIVQPIFRNKSSNKKHEGLKKIGENKEYKKIKYLPQNIFESFVLGELSEEEFRNNSGNWKDLEGWVDIGTATNLHTTIDRLSCSTLKENSSGQLYYSNDLFVKYNSTNKKKSNNTSDKESTNYDSVINYDTYDDARAGLFFLVKGKIDLIEGALRLLQHWGIGGDASTGKGHFGIEIADFAMKTPAAPTHFVTLSLYSPTAQEISAFKQNSDKMWYDIETRAGKLSIHSPLPADYEKASLVMFRESSTFPLLKQSDYGRLHIVKRLETMNIRQNGFAFPIPMTIKEQ